ncbi:uncharacterized protein HRG_11279 [Hirsutella rhossiliensis]|uniref:Uncharacterized protein n=1 Tax=Hirsutella rhossiliensis TaxID=111463 RepID=A0A9P8MM18_9HYPO|nr:uncharacterized protein HRG_11279 [Hirsutella rhossiliensis]KAH0957788.1 hypothetical protein HRG_11279 [Hirsutella rhossiliensis]
MAQTWQPNRPEDEVKKEVIDFLSWGRRYHQFMTELSTAAVARLRPDNRTDYEKNVPLCGNRRKEYIEKLKALKITEKDDIDPVAEKVDVNALDPDDVLTRSALIDVDFNVLDPDAVMAQSPLIDVDFNILDPDAVMAQSPLIDVDFNILDPDAVMAQSPLIDVDFNILDPDAVMAQSPLIDVDFNILDPDALMQPLSAEYNSPEPGAAPELIFNPAC